MSQENRSATPAAETLLYAEDLPVGSDIPLGSYAVTREEIIGFAAQWDPQSFHVDEEAADAGYFGGLIASGLHTMSILQRLAVLGAYRHWAVIAGRRLSDVQLISPLRPGMTVDAVIRLDTIDLGRPDRALVAGVGRLSSDGEVLLTMALESYVHRRPSEK